MKTRRAAIILPLLLLALTLSGVGCGGNAMPPPQENLPVLRTEEAKQLAEKILAATAGKNTAELNTLHTQVVEKMKKFHGKGGDEESDYTLLIGLVSNAVESESQMAQSEKVLRGVIERSKR